MGFALPLLHLGLTWFGWAGQDWTGLGLYLLVLAGLDQAQVGLATGLFIRQLLLSGQLGVLIGFPCEGSRGPLGTCFTNLVMGGVHAR